MAVNSWNFENSDWEDPNPQDFRYWACIQEAIRERYALIYRDRAGTKERFPNLDEISPYRMVADNEICKKIQTFLNALAPYFIDPSDRANWSDFPNTLGLRRATFYYSETRNSWRTQTPATTDYLFNREGCRYNVLPLAGSPASCYSDFLKACRNALNLMTIYAPNYVPAEWCQSGIWGCEDSGCGSATQAAEREHNENRLAIYLRVLNTGISETVIEHFFAKDTSSGGHGDSKSYLKKTSFQNPSSISSYRVSWCLYPGEYEEYCVNERLTFDFSLSFSPLEFYSTDTHVMIPDTGDDSGDDYEITYFRDSRSNSTQPVYFYHRPLDGNILVLLYSDTNLQCYGGDKIHDASTNIDVPTTYESVSNIPLGFHVFDVGALSTNSTFTIGDENALPASLPVSESEPRKISGATYLYYVLLDYGSAGGFRFR